MVELATGGKAGDFLDPALGMGVFTNIANEIDGMNISACEIDGELIKEFKLRNKYNLNLISDDYLSTEWEKKFDYIVCNPPYNKFQAISNRHLIQSRFNKKYHLKLSGYSNLCVYFLIKSLNELKKNGSCAYIIPYEFLNTGYGKQIKKYLLETKMLKALYVFDYNIKLFENADTTSCILLLENNKHEKVDFYNINNIKDVEERNFADKRTYVYEELDADEKWIKYFKSEENGRNNNNIVKVSFFGKVSRGIATGANNYFMLDEQKKSDLGLSSEVCMPCVSKSADIKGFILNNEIYGELKNKNKKVYLFDGEKAHKKADFDYIFYGESLEVHKKYLTSHRLPWYALERKKPAPILITVFNRNGIKVVRNEMMVHNLTTFHGFYPNKEDEDFTNILFCYLLTPVAQELLYESRREYGSGLDKFEPGDLTHASMLNLEVLTNEDKERILDIYSLIRMEPNDKLIDELNGIFKSYIY